MAHNKDYLYVDISASHPEVTGSFIICSVHYRNKHYEREVVNFAVDAGLYQEKSYIGRNSEMPIKANELDFILVTHSHIDHIGRLPFVVKNGFRDEIYTTNATKLYIEPALKDTVKIQALDNKKPLYTNEDVEKTVEHVVGCDFYTTIELVPEIITATFFPNGHLLGAAVILVQITTPYDGSINLLFTGDYNSQNEFFEVPDLPQYVLEMPINIISEATYGKTNSSEAKPCFKQILSDGTHSKKNIVVPVFSQGRGQLIQYLVKEMQEDDEISEHYPVYIDGTLLQTYTYMHEHLDLGIFEDKRNVRPNNSHEITYENRQEIINSPDKKSKIVITSAGMGTNGPAPMHIASVLPDRNGLIIFTGYQAEGTLGRILQETLYGQKVIIEGREVIKKATVVYTTEFSSHAKADELIAFLNKFSNLKSVSINHGSYESKNAFLERVANEVSTKNVSILEESCSFRYNPYGLVKKF